MQRIDKSAVPYISIVVLHRGHANSERSTLSSGHNFAHILKTYLQF